MTSLPSSIVRSKALLKLPSSLTTLHTLLHRQNVLQPGDKGYRDRISHNAAAVGSFRQRAIDLSISKEIFRFPCIEVPRRISHLIVSARWGIEPVGTPMWSRAEDSFIDIAWEELGLGARLPY